MKRRAFLLGSAAATANACAPTQTIRFAKGAGTGQIERVFIAAARDLKTADPLFGQKRTPTLQYGWTDVSIPPAHQIGEIEWPRPGATPDPDQHFLVADQKVLPNARSFQTAIGNAPDSDERILFVHGYNTRLPGLIYRVAQMRADFKPQAPMVAFAWPSGGDSRGYLYDRDSAIFARDDLGTVIDQLTEGGNVFLVAHSLGSFLVMEALRDLARRGDKATLNKISGVVLMSPDLDPDVFRRQAAAIGRLPQPFYLFVGQQDRALRLSSFLRGQKTQLGIIDSAKAVDGLGVTVVDFTELADGEDFDHFVPISAPGAIRQLRGLFDALRDGNQGFGKFVKLGERGPRQ